MAAVAESARTRLQRFIEDALAQGLDNNEIAECVVAEFADDPEIVEWSLRWTTQWLVSGLAHQRRHMTIRSIARGDSARSVFASFQQWLDDFDGELRLIAHQTRPQILAHVEDRLARIAGETRRARAERAIAHALPDDRTTPARYFRTSARQEELRSILATIYQED